jgi:hypothetical protein
MADSPAHHPARWQTPVTKKNRRLHPANIRHGLNQHHPLGARLAQPSVKRGLIHPHPQNKKPGMQSHHPASP